MIKNFRILRIPVSVFFLLLFTFAFAQQDTEQIDVVKIDESWQKLPQDFTLRVRLTAIEPQEPTPINWRWGGEGLGGEVVRGTLVEKANIGEWSPEVPVSSFLKGSVPSKFFLTFTAGRPGKPKSIQDRTKIDYSTNAEFEFEFSYKGKVVKRFKETGPDGGTVGIVIPFYKLEGGKQPDDSEFLKELTGLSEYALKRAEFLENLPWAKWPLPKLFAFPHNIGGYGVGAGYGIRHTNKAIIEAECRALRQLGANGLRAAPDFLLKMIAEREGYAKQFTRCYIGGAAGYPVPRYNERNPDPEAGCPFAPGVTERTKSAVEQSLNMLKIPVDEVWGLTVDEIGAVFDMAKEGKQHVTVCPYCAQGFREYLQKKGYKPSDFGQKDWSEVKPVNIWSKEDIGLKDPKISLLAYQTAMFVNYASAKLFTPIREALAEANKKKKMAIDSGNLNSPEAKQPWVYSYALRGNTFLLGGHSLDFFDFYRYADNGFVYETSNRGPQIWQWDSYLCDVGRVVTNKLGLRFGIYVKPHRGAPIQRTLTAISRGAKMIHFYTYGPDYTKGDSFSQDKDTLALTSKAAHIVGKAEDLLYNSSWAVPAEVAIVNPRSSEIWMRLTGQAPQWTAAWENAKWIYTALAHAHIPVDPLDEEMLANEDLSRYKVIYINGCNLTSAAAKKIAKWVEAGGILYTSGWGLARDEANQPLKILEPVLGLQERHEPEMWFNVALYGATSLESYNDSRRVLAPVPEGAKINGSGLFSASFMPVIGREILKPAPGTDILAKFADGNPAVTCKKYGKGKVYVVGFFPGLEYSAKVRNETFNMARDFDPGIRSYIVAPALTVVKPVVDISVPTVEAILLQNNATGKRAITLMNWTYRVSALRQYPNGRTSPVVSIVPFKDLTITVRGAGNVKKVASVVLDKTLDFNRDAETITFKIPQLDEGDVIILE